ncbi:MAG: hypothetical protein L0216_02560 [Planctomycetales bacterium]|nr:hypothetical protein [Planctomycetales bacterium]
MSGSCAAGALVVFTVVLALGCAREREDPPEAPPVVADGRITGGGPAADGRVLVRAFHAWSRVVVPGATVVCHETGAEATTDSTGTAVLAVPLGPFTVTGGAPGYGLATITRATTAEVGLPLPPPTPRIILVRGTVKNIAGTLSRAEVNDGRPGSPDPSLTPPAPPAPQDDTYQIHMAGTRNFHVTGLDLGSSGLLNLHVTPFELKVPSHKTWANVDFTFPAVGGLTISTASGNLFYPTGFTPTTVEVRPRAGFPGQDFYRGGGAVVGWGTVTSPFSTVSLEYAPSVVAAVSATDLVVDGVAWNSAGDLTRALLPHAGPPATAAFPSAFSLTFPPLPYQTAPANSTTAQVGLTPSLQWTATLPAGGGAYRVHVLAASPPGNLWDLWVPAGTTSVALPALPASLTAFGPRVGFVYNWQVRALALAPLAWDELTLDRLDWDGTGEALPVPWAFLP